jgi:hypothetical protein
VDVYTQCGERVIQPEIAKAIDHLLKEEKKPTKPIQFPVYQYEPNVV